MVVTSLLKIDMEGLLERAEKLANIRCPREVIEVSLEPRLNLLYIRFRKPDRSELG